MNFGFGFKMSYTPSGGFMPEFIGCNHRSFPHFFHEENSSPILAKALPLGFIGAF